MTTSNAIVATMSVRLLSSTEFLEDAVSFVLHLRSLIPQEAQTEEPGDHQRNRCIQDVYKDRLTRSVRPTSLENAPDPTKLKTMCIPIGIKILFVRWYVRERASPTKNTYDPWIKLPWKMAKTNEVATTANARIINKFTFFKGSPLTLLFSF